MTLADLQRRVDALGLQSLTVKLPPSGGYLVTGALSDGAEHKAWIQPGTGSVADDELLETTVEVFLRAAETRQRMVTRTVAPTRPVYIRCPACGRHGLDTVRCANCGQERVP